MSGPREDQRALLLRVARRAMRDYGLEPDFPPATQAEADAMTAAALDGDGLVDLRGLLWCSIDNDDSLDLDQLTAVRTEEGGGQDGAVTVLVAVADVTALVTPGSPIDRHAETNTTSVYTPARIFSMLPERLSTGLTSLNPGEDRPAVIAEMTVDEDGATTREHVYRALVRNHAKLAYRAIGAWLEGSGEAPDGVDAVRGLAAALRLQDEVAQRLRRRRHEQGALELETIEPRARLDGGAVQALVAERQDRAKQLIEDLMIAANGVNARFLEARRLPVMRRVVRSPERWQRIVDLAAGYGAALPGEPDSAALNAFLVERRTADPTRFPDLSLAIIKLLGRGEYAVSLPGQETEGHFGLAVREYAHSTAPNRRFPDIVTQRLVKAALASSAPPYSHERLFELADHCTTQEDNAQKVERRVRKSAAACYLADRLGEEFEGVVTGASAKGTWARTFDPPVEGRVVQGEDALDVGDKVRVRLIEADPERGFIDFACLRQS
ncbi:MAG TPA: RNB domain-containing ribonuclease [Thermoleophilia bacterium]|nr:RNB domain-containing ribonuclease [Thermoleophilia bacterium]